MNPAKLVEDMCEFLQRALPESIKLKTSVSSDVWNLFVDRSQLENALLNLVINSRDAIKEGAASGSKSRTLPSAIAALTATSRCRRANT